MHRDKRLGLALGILLIGVIAAFFFRNERGGAAAPPALADPQRIDEVIAQNEFVPYLDGLETDEDSSPASEGYSPSDDDLLPGPWEMSEILKEEEPDPNLPSVGGPPDPIETSVSEQYGLPIPDENSAWEAVRDVPTRKTGPPAQPVSTGVRSAYIIHRVRKGDTLSGLAQRYLGSSKHFAEIYQANRDLLKSPDDIRLGMPLRIPRTGLIDSKARSRQDGVEAMPVSSRQNSSAKSFPASGTSNRDELPPVNQPVRRFLPVRRPPLVPRPVDTNPRRGG